MSDLSKPDLHTIKPAKKSALSGSSVSSFERCVSSRDDSSVMHPAITVQEPFAGVYILDDVLDPDECESLCAAVDSSESLSFWSSGHKSQLEYRMFRNADTIEVNSISLMSAVWRRVEKLLLKLNVDVTEDSDDVDYERELVGSWVPSGLNHEMLFAKYPSSGSFAPHTDGRTIHDFNTRSFYSVILFLNDIPEASGGGTRFYESRAVKELKQVAVDDGSNVWSADSSLVTASVAAVRGRMLVFHQSLVHEGIPPRSPFEKYIIRSDVMLRRDPPLCHSALDREAYALFRQAEDLAESGLVNESVALFRRAFKLSPAMAEIMGQA